MIKIAEAYRPTWFKCKVIRLLGEVCSEFVDEDLLLDIPAIDEMTSEEEDFDIIAQLLTLGVPLEEAQKRCEELREISRMLTEEIH